VIHATKVKVKEKRKQYFDYIQCGNTPCLSHYRSAVTTNTGMHMWLVLKKYLFQNRKQE